MPRSLPRPGPRSLLDGVDLAELRAVAASEGAPGLVLWALLGTGALQHDPDDPDWSDRDRLLVDPALPLRPVASAAARAGYALTEGRLGRGASGVLGEAVALARLSAEAGEPYRVFAVLAASSLAEGGVWERLVEAGRFGVRTLCAVVLAGVAGPPEPTVALRAAGWAVREAPDAPAELLGGLDLLLASISTGPAALVVRPA